MPLAGRRSGWDALHKASTKIVNENKLIVVGKLSAKKLVKTKMAKSVNDAGTAMFKTMLKYKASAHAHDRDVNAAINILRLGRQTLRPEVAQEPTAFSRGGGHQAYFY